jgi:tRNA threonylcarbamoyladenosine biosynthesis protein TsaE
MILADEAATQAFGAALAAALRPGDVVTLSGPLGAGKTTLARALLHALGELGEVPSPSFALVQPYDHLTLPVWHADLYRIDRPSELIELGLDEIRSDGALIVEWPEHASGAWPDALALSLEPLDSTSRRLTAKVPPSWEGRWPLPHFPK